MKIFILILSWVIVTNLNLFGIDLDKENATTIEDLRLERFSKKPTKSYHEDTDSKIYGSTQLYFRKEADRKKQIQIQLYEEQQNSKFKSTYLDFTILNEENIA